MAGDKILRHLAIATMLEGCILVLMQLAVLITLHDWVDWICIGFWGGGLMIMAGMWALQRSQKKMITTSALAMIGGLCLVGFYSWHVSTVDCSEIDDRNQNQSRKSQWEDDSDLCDWRLASDILFIIFGLVAIGINMFMAVRGSTLTGAHSRRSSNSSHSGHHHPPAPVVHPVPVVHHHTTYVTPEATYPIPYNPNQQQQQQVMPASYPHPQQQPAHYPVYPSQHQNPHQPAYNPGYPAPGAPPYYKD
ncbi:uncharacterized protein LOC124196864 [Daphnia pulex]|uniref:uncharacterized protein LOC124196864 n=1 Tax=Daphnia pulex TaxID=6669 RepID=UPI001EDF535C|nr:uncharacterized protein LOC124196864 [Daphnia pulex]